MAPARGERRAAVPAVERRAAVPAGPRRHGARRRRGCGADGVGDNLAWLFYTPALARLLAHVSRRFDAALAKSAAFLSLR